MIFEKFKTSTSCVFDDIPIPEINDTLNSLEVIDIPGDDSGSDLPCQQRDTNVIVLSWIPWIQLPSWSKFLEDTPGFDLCGGRRLNQATLPDKGISETFQMSDFRLTFRTYPQFMQYRMDKISYFGKPVDLISIQSSKRNQYPTW